MTGTVPRDLDERADLEARLLSRRLQRRRDRIARLPRSGADIETFEVSPIQRLMWELHHEYPGECTFITLGSIWLRGPLDVDLFGSAFDAMVERHEGCRTLFRYTAADDPGGARLVQDVHRDLRHALPLVEVSPDEVDDAAADVIDLPFDLVRGPLARLALLRIAPDLHQAVLVLHHIVSDGVTMEIFVQELATTYLASAAGVDLALPTLEIQPVDAAAWQNDRLASGVAEREATYWRERLDGFVSTPLPTDVERTGPASSAGRTYQLHVPPESVTALGALAARERVTLFMLTLAAFHVLMSWYAGTRDVGVATPYSTRSRPELEQPVGAFINYLVLRADLHTPRTYRQLLAQVRQTCVTDFEHSDLPFDDVLEALGWEPQQGRHDLLRSLFTEESDPAVPLSADGDLSAELVAEPPWHHALRDFTVRVTAGDTGTHVIVTYRTDAFSEARIADIAADYRDLLCAIVADPDLALFDPVGRPALALRVPTNNFEDVS